MPHLVAIDLAEAVSIAMLTQPESGSRGADVDRFSGHVAGLLRGVHLYGTTRSLVFDLELPLAG